MIDSVLASLAPHYCCGCGEIGVILCEYCKNNIISEAYFGCLGCGLPNLSGESHVGCKLPYERAWCVSKRSGTVERLIDIYKFEYGKAAHKPLAELLLAALPELPDSTVVVPIPTVSKHIRQRGYDHIGLVARSIARKRNLSLERVLKRRSSTVQYGASKQMRAKQAAEAFVGRGRLRPGTPYLLVDDVVTTGSTLRYASEALLASGATVVWAAVIARQTIDS